ALVHGSLAGAATAKPSFTPDVAGAYVLSLVVNDGSLDSAPAVVMVRAEPPADVPPNADAGPDQHVVTGSHVSLNRSLSQDPDGGPSPLTYSWSFSSVPAGSASSDAAILDRFGPRPSFTPDVAGTYVVALVVSDGQAQGTDDVQIVVDQNTTPIADAGPD